MKIHIIAEGPTDRELIKSIIKIIIPGHLTTYISESNTQHKYRGKTSILFKYLIFSKFLHYAFAEMANIILIFVDNDCDIKDKNGVSFKRKQIINNNIVQFLKANSKLYPQVHPCFVIMIPVETLDYWIKCIKSNESDCIKLKKIEKIPSCNIKKETYGDNNIFFGWMISEKAIEQAKKEIESRGSSLSKLRCLNSFVDFEIQLKKCL